MSVASRIPSPPNVCVIGQIDHPDFREAFDLISASAVINISDHKFPELVIVAQSRPYAVRAREIESLQRRWPLSCIVALLGSWCEGETRTGRPWSGVERLYWYDFPAWWRRQLSLRAAGRCPDWARPIDLGSRIQNRESSSRLCDGVLLIRSACRESANALSDVLRRAGYSTVWQSPRRSATVVSGIVAGIWEGGQLSESEVDDLAIFCRALARENSPVVALLDFPRRDHVERAHYLGVAAVLGKPWNNRQLVATIADVASRQQHTDHIQLPRAA